MEVAVVVGPLVKLLPKLLSVVDNKRKQLDGLEVNAGFIRRDLQSIQEYIIGRPRSCRSITDHWIRDLRRLADDMEDCIDRFQVGKTSRIRFASQICKLRKRSKDTLDQLLNCINIAAANAATAPPDSDPAGVKDPEQEVVALLGPRSPSEGKLKVISVAGFGGSGSMTRLAHRVYCHGDVRGQFPLRAWVRAAPGMGVEKILQEIHDQLRLLILGKKQDDAAMAMGASSSNSIVPGVNGDAEVDRPRLAGLLKTGR